MFIDPAGQYRFAMPLGWAYDPERSHLITVIFVRWGQPDEMLSVRAMPTFASPEAEEAQWYQALGERCFPPRMHPFTRMRCQGLPAALAEAHETDPKIVHRRLLVVRGTRLDIVAEHRAPEPSTGPRLSDALSAICRSLEVSTNRFLPEFAEQQSVDTDLERAQDAANRKAYAEAVDPALSAMRAARATYLYSVVANTPLPEIPAIISLMDALLLIGWAAASLLHLRDAEHLALRAGYTLEHLPFVRPERRRQVRETLNNRMEGIRQLQARIIRKGDTAAPPPGPGPGLALLRVDPLLEQAQQFSQAGENELALQFCETAIADLFIVLSSLEGEGALKARPLPPEVAQKMASTGVETPEEQWAVFRQLGRHVQLDTLQKALALRAQLQSLTGDETGAAETSEFLIPLAETLSSPQETVRGHIEPSEGQAQRAAYARIQHATNLAAVEDGPSLEQAHKTLDEAETILDRIAEEGVLRVWLCLVRASVLHSQRRVDGALERIDRGLRAAAAIPDPTEQHVRELKTIKSQFLIHLGRLSEARDLAFEVAQLPEGEGARALRDRASHYLNLAIIDSALDNRDGAAHSLVEALRRVLKASPFGEESLRILMVASRLYMEHAPMLSYQLNLAAAATLDARRATIGSDRFRVGFDESTRRREVYEDLVGRLVAFGAGAEAVAAADRSRARSLNELLARPGTASDPPAPVPAGELPTMEGEDVQQALGQGADYIISMADAALRQGGAVAPLLSDEVEALARTTGARALLIQPVRQQVALLLVESSGAVKVEFSPLSLKELLNLVDAVQKQFFIRLVPRGENEKVESSPRNGDLDQTLTSLWSALISPIADRLKDGEPLIIVPYREFTLIPFGLLHSPQGSPLIERHALSIVPSLATLRALQGRGRWTRAHPTRTYLAGDPAIAPRLLAAGMKRLPAARDEVEAVTASLKAAGVSEDSIISRLDDAAHEESYRREARGCDLVHLSCHAKAGVPAYTSCLYFAPHGSYNGMLLASEVADVKLDDALVFLAACETGQGRATADGVIGLGRAFLEAGARAVILSLWKVEDAATAALAGHFYRTLLESSKPLNSAEALRAAMLATRTDLQAGRILTKDNQPLEADAANWAPFMVLGDGLSVHYKGGQ